MNWRRPSMPALASAHISSTCVCAMQEAKDHTLLSMDTLLASPLGSASNPLPTRRVDIDLTPVSLVLGTPIMCYPNSPLEFQLLNGNSRRSHATAVGGSGQSFKGDVVAAVQPNIQAELQDAKVSANSSVFSSCHQGFDWAEECRAYPYVLLPVFCYGKIW